MRLIVISTAHFFGRCQLIWSFGVTNGRFGVINCSLAWLTGKHGVLGRGQSAGPEGRSGGPRARRTGLDPTLHACQLITPNLPLITPKNQINWHLPKKWAVDNPINHLCTVNHPSLFKGLILHTKYYFFDFELPKSSTDFHYVFTISKWGATINLI